VKREEGPRAEGKPPQTALIQYLLDKSGTKWPESLRGGRGEQTARRKKRALLASSSQKKVLQSRKKWFVDRKGQERARGGRVRSKIFRRNPQVTSVGGKDLKMMERRGVRHICIKCLWGRLKREAKGGKGYEERGIQGRSLGGGMAYNPLIGQSTKGGGRGLRLQGAARWREGNRKRGGRGSNDHPLSRTKGSCKGIVKFTRTQVKKKGGEPNKKLRRIRIGVDVGLKLHGLRPIARPSIRIRGKPEKKGPGRGKTQGRGRRHFFH